MPVFCPGITTFDQTNGSETNRALSQFKYKIYRHNSATDLTEHEFPNAQGISSLHSQLLPHWWGELDFPPHHLWPLASNWYYRTFIPSPWSSPLKRVKIFYLHCYIHCDHISLCFSPTYIIIKSKLLSYVQLLRDI